MHTLNLTSNNRVACRIATYSVPKLTVISIGYTLTGLDNFSHNQWKLYNSSITIPVFSRNLQTHNYFTYCNNICIRIGLEVIKFNAFTFQGSALFILYSTPIITITSNNFHKFLNNWRIYFTNHIITIWRKAKIGKSICKWKHPSWALCKIIPSNLFPYIRKMSPEECIWHLLKSARADHSGRCTGWYAGAGGEEQSARRFAQCNLHTGQHSGSVNTRYRDIRRV